MTQESVGERVDRGSPQDPPPNPTPFGRPTLLLLGNPLVVIDGMENTSYKDPGVIAISELDGDISSSVTSKETRSRGVHGQIIDLLKVSYLAKDSLNQSTEASRDILRVSTNWFASAETLEDGENQGSVYITFPRVEGQFPNSMSFLSSREVVVSIALNFDLPEDEASAIRASLYRVTDNCSTRVPIQTDTPVTLDGTYVRFALSSIAWVSGTTYELEVSDLRHDFSSQPFSIRRRFLYLHGDVNQDRVLSPADLERFRERRAEIEATWDPIISYPDLEIDGRTSSDWNDYSVLESDENALIEILESGGPAISPCAQVSTASNPTVHTSRHIEKPYERPVILEQDVTLPSANLSYADRALVIYNRNSDAGEGDPSVPDGRELALYYAQRRNIPAEQVCAVGFPPSQFLTLSQLRGARQEVLSCLCQLVPPERSVASCGSDASLPELKANSKISHFILVGDIPERLYSTGWTAITPDNNFTVTADQQGPVMDAYFAEIFHNRFFQGTYNGQRLNNLPNTYGTLPLIDGDGNVATSTSEGDRFGVKLPALDPKVHAGALAVGRIKGTQLQRAMDLIDRTLAAETRGISGNLFLGMRAPDQVDYATDTPGFGRPNTDNFFRYLLDLVNSSQRQSCTDYLLKRPIVFEDPLNSWSPDRCRVGATVQGQIPGEVGSTIPLAVDASLFLGAEYLGQTMKGFDGFHQMKKFRKQSGSCTELCSELPLNEQESCRENSTDVMKELNTSCVGVNPGFLGWQYRSWPVQYYGLYPAGWSTSEYGFGQKTPPVLKFQGGSLDPGFSDSRFIRFGTDTSTAAPECVNPDTGSLVSCPGTIAINLSTRLQIPSGPLALQPNDRLRITFRYRASKPGGAFNFGPSLRTNSPSGWTYPTGGWVYITAASASWQTMTFEVTLPSGFTFVHYADFGFYASMSNGLRGTLDLDNVEVYLMSRTDTNQVAAELLSRDTGGFAAANLSTTHGDWAANVMERLNGIAWWGNVNHNWHGGHGFAAYMDFGYTFFSGRSLGESILQAKRTEDGLRYGDPLYRPMGVKISTHLPGRSTKSRGLVPRHLSQTERYTVTAFQGRQDTPWKLSACWRDLGASSVSPCAESRVLMRGTRAVEDFDTGIAMASLVRDDRRSEMVELTLELGNPEDPQSIFVDRASFGYWALHPGGVVPYVEPTQ